jgi:arginase
MSGVRTASLIGAPTDVGAADRGASMGPEALRVAGLAAALRQRELEVVDLGNLNGPGNPWQPPHHGYRHLPQVVRWNELVHEAVYGRLRAGQLPILLGGDHSLGIGSISAVARHCREQGKQLRVLWLDAHADFNTRELSASGNVHGMPLAVLCGFGPRELTAIGTRAPAIDPAWVRQIGIRSVDEGEKRFVHEQGLDVFDMRHVDEMGMRATMEQALAGIDHDTHLHVSFDVDFLDPEIAPGVACGALCRPWLLLSRPAGPPQSSRHAGPGWPDLPRGAVVHGDDRRHPAPRLARRGGAQSCVRRAQQDRGARRGPDRVAVRQEHAGAPAGMAAPQVGAFRTRCMCRLKPGTQRSFT